MVMGLMAMLLSISVAQVRPNATPAWITALKSDNPKVRQESIVMATNSGAKAVVPLVILLFNARNETYQTALQALRATVYRSLREGQSGTRREVIDALFSQISPNAKHANAVRNILLELLGTVAQEQDVPRIASYFRDTALREQARLALTRMNYPSVNRVLLGALPLAVQSFQVGLIQSLEERVVLEAVPFLQSLLSSSATPITEVRLAALHALGKLPDISSAPFIWNMMEGNKPENRSASQAYLALAEALLLRGESTNAHALYGRFYSVALNPAEKCAALRGLVHSDSASAESLLFEALVASDHEVRGFAVRLLSEAPSASVTQGMLSALPQVSLSLRPILLRALGNRSGNGVREAIMEASLSQNSELRTAAFRALLHRQDVYNTTRLQVFHRALPVAQSDTERLVLLSGLQSIASSTSLPYLFENLAHKSVQAETWATIQSIADNIAYNKRASEAIPLYERIVRSSEKEALVRHAMQRLRQLGAKADFAAQAGYIEHWWVLGPLPGRDLWRTHDVLNVQLPIEIEQPVSVESKQYRWRYLHSENSHGLLDLAAATPFQGKAATYAYAEVSSPVAQDVLIKIGSDDDYFCWLNGMPVSRFVGDRGWKVDEDIRRIRLTQGTNRILVKVLNAGGDWQVSVRLTDIENQPLLLAQRAQNEMVKAERASSVEVGGTGTPAQEKRILLSSGLEYVEIEEGKGEIARNGDNVAVHYSGSLSNGKRIDSTRDKGEPLYFTLGNAQVIPGFDQGIRGMRVGGKRRLMIPPALGYAEQGAKNIPPNATLIYEVELISSQFAHFWSEIKDLNKASFCGYSLPHEDTKL